MLFSSHIWEQVLYNRFKKDSEIIDDVNTAHYSNLTVPGGTNYTENEITTPASFFSNTNALKGVRKCSLTYLVT